MQPILIQQVTCSFCKNTAPGPDGTHPRCPGAIRVPGTDRIIVCKCCTPPNGQCTTCGNRDDVDPLTFYCLDRYACSARVQKRMEANPLHRQLQEVRLEAAAKRKRDRHLQGSILNGVVASGVVEVDSFETTRNGKPRKPARPREGKCACCGEPTKGGRFLPGHDARLVSALIKRIDAGDQDAWDAVEQHGWSGKKAFAVRQQKRQETAR